MIEAKSLPLGSASPPGDTIKELLEERGWTRVELARRLDCSPKHVNELLHGEAAITADVAGRLARVLGSTSTFWMKLDASYRAELEENSRLNRLAQEAPGWLEELPVAWMEARGWIRKWPTLAEKTEELLHFFQVSSVDVWRSHHARPLAAFRTAGSQLLEVGAVAAWLCEAERQAIKLRCAPYDAAGFKSLLPELRKLTGETQLTVLREQLQTRCAAVGVAVILLPAPPGCPANGATLWLEPTRAMMVLSLRYKTNDRFWFTFFHEACHILKHGKKMEFLEEVGGLDPKLEREADEFAAELLVPVEHSHQLPYLKKISDIEDYAKTIGVDPGIVVGQMQHKKVVGWHYGNQLKKTYRWEELEV